MGPQTVAPAAAETRMLLAPPQTKLLAPPPDSGISDADFLAKVHNALEAVAGTLVFQVRVGHAETAQHVAAASIGAGPGRQFLLLSMPLTGGTLKVETASRSANPLAQIAASYAGLLEVFKAAA